MLGRIHNQVVRAINENILLPKAMVFVLDDDLIEMAVDEKAGTSELFGKLLDWLVNSIHELIKERKKQLPMASIRDNLPQVYWVEAPQHKNFTNNLDRRKFNSVLQSVTSVLPDTQIMRMKKIWNAEDDSLFQNGKFTSEGLLKFWSSIDNGFEYNDTGGRRPIAKQQPQRAAPQDYRRQGNFSGNYDRYHWGKNTNNFRQQQQQQQFRFKLPRPPTRRY